VHLVGFITFVKKFVTMHGHMNLKIGIKYLCNCTLYFLS